MTENIKREISRAVPNDITKHLSIDSTALFTAYGCVMLERDTGKSYVYTAVNLKTRKREVLSRRRFPLTTSGVAVMVEKIRCSSIADTGSLEADRPFNENITLADSRKILNALFKEILPHYGYTIRAEQVSLAEHILDTINHRCVSLAEAEVGTGKTLAYLIPAILAKRGRLGCGNLGLYAGAPYTEMTDMPVVVATSSIALQKAIVADYIPELSDILLEHGVIKTPLTAVIRKGREHYVCEHKLRAHILFERNASMRKILERLLKPGAAIDIAEIDGLTAHAKRKISVPERCDMNCPNRDACPYLRFRKQAGSPKIDIQVCNHNYLLADTLHRAKEQRPLIPNYQIIVIDEAHKFLAAARSMYGTQLSSLTLPSIKDSIYALNLKQEEAQKLARRTVKKLSCESDRLFTELLRKAQRDEAEDEAERFTAEIDAEAARHIINIRNIADRLIELLLLEPASGNGVGRKAQILWELGQARTQAAELTRHKQLICWLETTGDDESRLCAIPKNLDERLYNDIWNKGLPIVLTSGTLSAGGAGTSCANFSHIKRVLGLERICNRLTEASKPSPFNYHKNALLYISENVPFPDQRDKEYIAAVADEAEKLVIASHGHAAVLFTSYKVMDMAWELLGKRSIPFPMFRLDKGGIREIERFKQSGNGILFASGALWEGIDIPGDALSMLIIVKLPFAVPDPIGEYERTLYTDMAKYKSSVVLPEMLIKLKQGFGRLIRTETDTGVVAIFDSRVNFHGSYREPVLGALPSCEVTDSIDTVEDFFKKIKPPEYFM